MWHGDKTDKPKTVKRPAKPRAKWLVPNGIAFEVNGDEQRYPAGSEIHDQTIPPDLEAEYADRGDIIPITYTTGD